MHDTTTTPERSDTGPGSSRRDVAARDGTDSGVDPGDGELDTPVATGELAETSGLRP